MNETLADNCSEASSRQSVSLAENVLITLYPLSNVNPTPKNNVHDDMLDEFLSPRRLKQLSGKENLSTVTSLQMCIDSERISLGNFGDHLPNLTELKLSDGIIPRMRDLGTSIQNLMILWMPHCCLHCLYGASSMPNLKELYLAYNEIVDISPLGMLEYLEVLDLEGNLISEDANLAFLSMCTRLSNLTLEGNPIAMISNKAAYRQQVFESIPSLDILDNELKAAKTAQKNSLPSTADFTEEWDHIDKIMKEIGLVKTDNLSSIFASTNTMNGSKSGDSNRLPSGRVGNQFHIKAEVKRKLQPALIGRHGLVINCSPKCQDISEKKIESTDETKPENNSIGENEETICGGIGRALRKNMKKRSTQVAAEPEQASYVSESDDIESNDNLEYALKKLNKECDEMLGKTSKWKQYYRKSLEKYNERTVSNGKLRSRTPTDQGSIITPVSSSRVSNGKEETSSRPQAISRPKSNEISTSMDSHKELHLPSATFNLKPPVNAGIMIKRRSNYVQKLQPLKATKKFPVGHTGDESSSLPGQDDIKNQCKESNLHKLIGEGDRDSQTNKPVAQILTPI